MGELFRALCIYILIPVAGLLAFVLLIRTIRRAGNDKLLELAYFLMFVGLGGWLLIALTAEFLFWSGIASAGTFYLLLVAPFVSAVMAWKLRGQRGKSLFYSFAFWVHIALSSTVVVTTSFLFGFPVRLR